MRQYFFILFPLLAFTFSEAFLSSGVAGTLPAAGIESIDRIVAIVGSRVITQAQLDQAYYYTVNQAKKKQIPLSDQAVLKQQLLEKLINETLINQIAESHKISISTDELNEAVRKLAETNRLSVAQLKVKIAEDGISYKYFLSMLKQQLLIAAVGRKALAQSISVSDEEINAFLEKYQREKAAFAQYNLIDVLIPIPDNATASQKHQAQLKAKQVLEAVRGGKDPKQIPGVEVRALEWRKAEDLPDLFNKALEAMSVGQLAGPLQAQNGFHVLKLLDVHQSKEALPTKDQVSRFLEQQKFQVQLEKWVKTLRKEAYVKILVPPSSL